MEIKIILAQIIAIIISCINAVGTTSTNKRNILLLNGCANSLSSAQYILLGAYTGCTSCILAIIRNIIFTKYEKKNKKTPLSVLILFIVISIIVNIPLYTSWFAIIPILNLCVYGYGLWQSNMETSKKTTIFVGITGIIYNLLTMAYVSVFNASIDFFGGLIGFIRIKKEAKAQI